MQVGIGRIEVQKIDGEDSIADVLTNSVKAVVLSAVTGRAVLQQRRRQKEQQQRWHVALEKNHFSEEHDAFVAESAASRAEHAKEVEALKDTRSPTQHPMTQQSHRCHCCGWMLCPGLLPRSSGIP